MPGAQWIDFPLSSPSAATSRRGAHTVPSEFLLLLEACLQRTGIREHHEKKREAVPTYDGMVGGTHFHGRSALAIDKGVGSTMYWHSGDGGKLPGGRLLYTDK